MPQWASHGMYWGTSALRGQRKKQTVSTRGIEVPKRHAAMNRAEFIQHGVMMGFDPQEIENFCFAREPEAYKNEELARIIREAIRKQRFIYIEALERSKHMDISEEARLLSDITPCTIEYLDTHLEKLNWVFGGGLPKGQLIVLAGEPGVGKTRVVICIAAGQTRMGRKVHYFQGEVKPEIFADWAFKQDPAPDLLLVDSTTIIEEFVIRVGESKPDLVIVDSVDMFRRSFSPSEARRTQSLLRQAAEKANCPFLLIHHLNKQGSVKGSNDIEYLCDVVAYARSHSFSTVQREFTIEIPTKNRFGITGRSAVFQHTETGVIPVVSVTHGTGFKLAKSVG